MNLTTYTLDRDTALAHLAMYRRELRNTASKAEHVQELADTYYQLSRGRAVIDVLDSFKAAGMDERGEPRIAICRADAKWCFLKRDNVAGEVEYKFFATQADSRWITANNRPSFHIPRVAFPGAAIGRDRWLIRTVAPLIPPAHMPKADLSNYHLLWEVKEWEAVPPQDPLLLKKITDTLFVVLAQWDLTPIEQAVMRGALAFGRA